MFGANEDLARVFNDERRRTAECKGERAEWCRLEFRTGIRHG